MLTCMTHRDNLQAERRGRARKANCACHGVSKRGSKDCIVIALLLKLPETSVRGTGRSFAVADASLLRTTLGPSKTTESKNRPLIKIGSLSSYYTLHPDWSERELHPESTWRQMLNSWGCKTPGGAVRTRLCVRSCFSTRAGRSSRP